MSELIFKNTNNKIVLTNIALKGDPGQDGQDGVGISKVYINSYGELIIEYTDGSDENLGVISSTGGGTGSYIATQEEFIAVANQTNFTLSKQASQVSIVTVNGLQQNGTDYVLSGTDLSFTYPLEDGDIVMITHSVPLSSIDMLKKIKVDNIQNNVMITVPIINKTLAFAGTVLFKDGLGATASYEVKGCIYNDTTTEFIGTPIINVIGITIKALNENYDLQIQADAVNDQLVFYFSKNSADLANAQIVLNINEMI
jgi:hypothetical protein